MKGTLRERGPGSWQLVVFIGYDADGKMLRRHIGFKGTKREAQRGHL